VNQISQSAESKALSKPPNALLSGIDDQVLGYERHETGEQPLRARTGPPRQMTFRPKANVWGKQDCDATGAVTSKITRSYERTKRSLRLLSQRRMFRIQTGISELGTSYGYAVLLPMKTGHISSTTDSVRGDSPLGNPSEIWTTTISLTLQIDEEPIGAYYFRTPRAKVKPWVRHGEKC
jgi:hypothetical protein